MLLHLNETSINRDLNFYLCSSLVSWSGPAGSMHRWTGTGKRGEKLTKPSNRCMSYFSKHSIRWCRSELVSLCRYDSLSPGEMQRLCFARLFYLQPKYAGVFFSVYVMQAPEGSRQVHPSLHVIIMPTVRGDPDQVITHIYIVIQKISSLSAGWGHQCSDGGGRGSAVPHL